MSESDQSSSAQAAALAPPPAIRTRLGVDEALARLDRLASKGRLPGFATYPDSGRFEVVLFGEPFDRALVGSIHRKAGEDGARTIEFAIRTKAKTPAIFAIAIIFTIWPGVVLTDSLIPGAWGWWPTWWWYMPLVIVPLPFMFPRMWKKSSASAADHLAEQYQRIRDALEGEAASEAA